MKSGKRVLLVTSSYPRWEGDSTTPFIQDLAQDLIAEGWRVDVLAPHAPGARRQEEFGGVFVSRFRYMWPESQQTVCYRGGALINLRTSKFNLLKLPPLLLAQFAAVAKSLARGSGYDLVHSHWVLPQGLTSGLAAALEGTAHVTTVHGSDVLALRSPVWSPFKRTALQLSDRVTVNSTATRSAVEDLLGGPSSKVSLIPIGVSLRAPREERAVVLRRQHRRGQGPLLVFVGRLVEEKGVSDFIGCVAHVADRLPDVTAVLVGEGQERQRFEAEVRELGLQDRVRFAGWIDPDAVPDYLGSADIFISSSHSEAQGLAILEAMAAETPVVAARVGGVPDIVRHDETGLLTSVRAPHELANAVVALATNPGLAEELKHRAAAFVRASFGRTTTARAFSSLFAEVLSRRAAG